MPPLFDTYFRRTLFNVHTHYPNTSYKDVGLVHGALAQVGGPVLLRNNDPLGGSRVPDYDWIFVSSAMDPKAVAAQAMQALGCVRPPVAIECTNEPGGKYAPIAQAIAANNALIAAVNYKVPVIGSALPLPNPTNAAAFGRQHDIQYGAIHDYRADLDATAWAKRINGSLADSQTVAPHLPVVLTETGYWMGPKLDPSGTPYNHHPTDPELAKQWIVTDTLAWWAAGVAAVGFYQLLDQSTEVQAFGLFTTKGQAKPHTLALIDLLGKIGPLRRDDLPTLSDQLLLARAACESHRELMSDTSRTLTDLAEKLAVG